MEKERNEMSKEKKEAQFQYTGENEEVQKAFKPEDRWKNKNLFKRIVKFFTPEPPPFNMPKSQSCPKCNAYSKREKILSNGANYRCRHHGLFFLLSNQYKEK
jgi:hypothetical protein